MVKHVTDAELKLRAVKAADPKFWEEIESLRAELAEVRAAGMATHSDLEREIMAHAATKAELERARAELAEKDKQIKTLTKCACDCARQNPSVVAQLERAESNLSLANKQIKRQKAELERVRGIARKTLSERKNMRAYYADIDKFTDDELRRIAQGGEKDG